jgi:hypothetical protein
MIFSKLGMPRTKEHKGKIEILEDIFLEAFVSVGRVSSRAAQTARDLTVEQTITQETLSRRSLRTLSNMATFSLSNPRAIVGSLAVCAARDDRLVDL